MTGRADSSRLSPGLQAAFVAAVVSGFAVFVNGLALKRFDDATVYTTAKNLIAGAILLGALKISMGGQQRRTPVPVPSWHLAVVAVVGGSVPFVLFFEGLQRAESTNAAFIHKTLVVWVAVGATVWLGERVTMWHAGAIGLLVAGHLVLAGGGPAAYGSGEAMIAAATIFWSVEVMLVKRLLPGVGALTAASARMAGGSIVLVSWVAVNGNLDALLGLTSAQLAWLALTGSTLAMFVASWYRALALAPAIDVTAVLVVGAVLTGALNVGFRGFPVTIESAGYLLLLAGAAAIAHAHGSRPGRRVPA